jgi:hypothetical protein
MRNAWPASNATVLKAGLLELQIIAPIPLLIKAGH